MPPSATQKFISWFFPRLCIHCQREGAWLCAMAQEQLAAEPLFPETIKLPLVDDVFIRGSYDCLPLQQLIHKLKYSYWSAAKEVLPEILGPLSATLKQLPSDTVIVPVPLHSRRIKERGFNQALIIAQALHQLTNWPVRPWLQRHRYTAPQAQLSESKRKKNMIAAFVPRLPVSKVISSVILVDDVLTTGSTLSECAKVLSANGVRHIYACAIAKG